MARVETPCRMQSPLLSRYPWTTGSMTRDDLRSIVDSQHEMASFLEHLHQFERAIFSQEKISSAYFRDLLQVKLLTTEESGTVILRPLDNEVLLPADGRGWIKLASIILAYRLADVIGLLTEVQIPQPQKVKRKSFTINKYPNGLAKLNDWVSLLTSFKSVVNKENPTSASPGARNTRLKLIKWLSCLDISMQSAKMKFNLVAAAIHLAFMRSHQFGPNEVPELTSDVQVLIATEFSETGHSMEEVTLDPEEFDLVRRLVLDSDSENAKNVHSLRNPLHISLGISPLCLLLPTQLLKVRMGRRTLLDIFLSLGNEKPPALKKVEKTIWNIIFELARGSMDPNKAIATLCSSLPWDEINDCSPKDRAWFAIEHVGEDLTNFDEALNLGGDVPESHVVRLLNEDGGSGQQDMAVEGELRPVVSQSQGVGEKPPKEDGVDEDDENGEQGAAIPETEEPTESSSRSLGTLRTEAQQDLEVGEEAEMAESPSRSQDPQAGDANENQNMEGEQEMEAVGSSLTSHNSQVEESDEDHDMDAAETLGRPSTRRSHGPRVNLIIPPLPRDSSSRSRIKKRKYSPESLPSDRKKRKEEDGLVKRAVPGSSIDDPIDVDNLNADTRVTLDIEDSPQKYKGKEMTGYEPTGVPFRFTPALHILKDLSLLASFDEAISGGFVNHLPRHVSAPKSSAFCVISESDFNKFSAEEVQALLRNKHILVTEMSASTVKFDARGLSSLMSLSAVTDIQDQSIGRRQNKFEYLDDRLRQGPVRSLLSSSERSGKILNALNFPLPEKAMGSFPFSTDLAAWKSIKGTCHCPADEPPRVGDIRWGLAATAGALSWWHIDSNGFGTYVDAKSGSKWWIIGRRKFDDYSLDGFSEVDFFLNDFQVDMPNADRWDLEAVVLTPGTRLIMRPNTMHAVFSPENCIFEGGHFYAASTIQDTMFAIVHTFINNFYTNTDKSSHGLLLRRIGWFYHEVLVRKRLQEDKYAGHIPNLVVFASVLDLFTFCNLLFLFNVLDFRTYSDAPGASNKHRHLHDVNDIPIAERYQMALARGCCFNILHWFFTEYEITDKTTNKPIDGFKEVAMEYLSHQASTILAYKKKALFELGKVKDNSLSEACSSFALEKQINLCIQNHPEIPPIKILAIDEKHLSLAFPDRNRYIVRKLEESRPHQSPDDLLKYGTTAADSILFDFLEKRRAYMGQA